MADHIEFLRSWARDIREAGVSVDADTLDGAADEIEKLRSAMEPFARIPPVVYSALDETPLYAAHYWAIVGRPDKTHFTREDLARARECLGLASPAVPSPSDPSPEEEPNP